MLKAANITVVSRMTGWLVRSRTTSRIAAPGACRRPACAAGACRASGVTARVAANTKYVAASAAITAAGGSPDPRAAPASAGPATIATPNPAPSSAFAAGNWSAATSSGISAGKPARLIIFSSP